MGKIPQEVMVHAGSDEQVAMGGTMSATRNTLIVREKT
jgi:hypothetical protein